MAADRSERLVAERVYLAGGDPAGRSGHSLHLCADDRLLVGFGGYDGRRRRKDFLTLAGFDAAANDDQTPQWRRHVGPAWLTGRAGHVSVQLDRRRVFVFGGYDSSRVVLGDAFLVSCDPAAEPVVDVAPVRPAAVALAAGEGLERRWAAGWAAGAADARCVFVHGGWNDGGASAALLCYSTARNQWRQLRPSGAVPSARRWHAALALSAERALLFGGYSAAGRALSDLLLFDAPSESWRLPATRGPAPPARCRPGLLALSDRLLLCFGGYGDKAERQATAPLADAYLLHTDDMRWQNVSAKSLHLLARAGPATASLAAAGGLVFGGIDAKGDHRSDLIYVHLAAS